MTIQGMSFYDFIGKLIPGTLLWTPWIMENEYQTILANNLLLAIVAFTGFFITGLIWNYFVKIITFYLRLNRSMLTRAHKDVAKEFVSKSQNNCWPTKSISSTNARALYFEAYTNAQTHNILGNVPILESQENFIKNIWLLLFYYIVIVHSDAGNFPLQDSTIIIISIIIAILALPVIWYMVQTKIYKMVWECEAYLTLINQNTID